MTAVCTQGRHPARAPQVQRQFAILNHADPLFLKQVTGQGVLLHASPSRWQEFRLYAFRRYQDHQRLLAMEREYVTRKLSLIVSDLERAG